MVLVAVVLCWSLVYSALPRDLSFAPEYEYFLEHQQDFYSPDHKFFKPYQDVTFQYGLYYSGGLDAPARPQKTLSKDNIYVLRSEKDEEWYAYNYVQEYTGDFDDTMIVLTGGYVLSKNSLFSPYGELISTWFVNGVTPFKVWNDDVAELDGYLYWNDKKLATPGSWMFRVVDDVLYVMDGKVYAVHRSDKPLDYIDPNTVQPITNKFIMKKVLLKIKNAQVWEHSIVSGLHKIKYYQDKNDFYLWSSSTMPSYSERVVVFSRKSSKNKRGELKKIAGIWGVYYFEE